MNVKLALSAPAFDPVQGASRKSIPLSSRASAISTLLEGAIVLQSTISQDHLPGHFRVPDANEYALTFPGEFRRIRIEGHPILFRECLCLLAVVRPNADVMSGFAEVKRHRPPHNPESRESKTCHKNPPVSKTLIEVDLLLNPKNVRVQKHEQSNGGGQD
jgi:hypothetical protein